MIKPIINERFKFLHNSRNCACVSCCPHVVEILKDHSRLEIENRKLKKIKEILIKLDATSDNYDWPPKSNCKSSTPWNECCKECDPIWHIEKIMNEE